MNTKDSLSVLFGVQISLGESGESLITMGHVHTTISCTLEGTKDSGTSGGTSQTQIKNCLEGSCTLTFLNFVVLTIDLSATLVLGVQLVLLQQTTCAQETSGVACGVVGETHSGTIGGEFVCVGISDDHVSLHLGVGNLADDVLVGETDDESVLGGVVLVLVLANHSSAGTEIGLTLTPPSELGLEPTEIGFVFHDLDEHHLALTEMIS
mmetsp:Transcript_126048/g.177843  ORF Transcript_126048/g.177843 Transcript_126048/m.177843 type:complete len:209 (-) Transcript_126048:8-634(-)